MSFDYGDELVGGSSKFKNPELGKHCSRLAGVIHLGMCPDEFRDKKTGKVVVKDPTPFVQFVYMLLEDNDKLDDGSPMYVSEELPLKRGDKAKLTARMKVLLTPAELVQYEAGTLQGGFGDLIGRPLELDLKGSDAKNEDGTPKYVNIATVGKLHEKLLAMTPPMPEDAYVPGFVKYEEMTREVVEFLSPYIVATKMLKAVNLGVPPKGMASRAAIDAILAEKPDAFSLKKKDDAKEEGPKIEDKAPPPDLDSEEEF